jgi:hypothetical protein
LIVDVVVDLMGQHHTDRIVEHRNRTTTPRIGFHGTGDLGLAVHTAADGAHRNLSRILWKNSSPVLRSKTAAHHPRPPKKRRADE